jgi:hypothetical protein
MLIELCGLIYSILSVLGHNDSHIRASFITDRRIESLIGDDIVESFKILLRENFIENQKSVKFIWDKHFPRPFIYILEGEVSLTQAIDSRVLLKCLSIKEEEIYQIEINKKSQKIIFYDKNKNLIRAQRQDNEFIISNHERGMESIMYSVVYMINIEFIDNHYSTLCKYFDVFLNELRVFMNKTKKLLDYDEPIFLKTWEVEVYIVRMINTFVKSFATLKIPALNKLEHLKPIEDFRKKVTDLSNLIKELVIVINIQVDKYHEQSIDIDFSDLTYFRVVAAFFVEELKKVETSTHDIYKNYLRGMTSINNYIEEVKMNTNNNTQIALDCDTVKVDKFIENYAFYLIQYCEILDKCDEVYLNEYFYYQNEYYLYNNLNKFETYLTPLLETFTDIVISNEMRKYILNYKNDKTDFLIFTQNEYFLNKLTYRILENLNDLLSALELKKKIDGFVQGKLVELSENDQMFMNEIEVLNHKFKKLFYVNDRSTPLTFYEIIESITVEVKEDDILLHEMNITKDGNDKLKHEQNKTLEVCVKDNFSLLDTIILIVLVVLLCLVIYLIISEQIKFN